jgi:dUTP pyrophosphatase
MIDVKIFNNYKSIVDGSVKQNPEYATAGSSGMDLRADIVDPIKILPMARAIVSTGIHIELPTNTEAQIRSRSGLAAKQGIMVLNSPGTIDEDYTGEIKVILINLSTEEVTINPNDRIAQIVFAKVEKAKFENVESIDQLHSTERGAGGFGSTGVK